MYVPGKAIQYAECRSNITGIVGMTLRSLFLRASTVRAIWDLIWIDFGVNPAAILPHLTVSKFRDQTQNDTIDSIFR